MLRVSAKDASGFAQVWRHNGIAIPLQPIHMQFAADFASVVLKNFIENAQKAQAMAAAKAAEAAKQQIVVEG